MKKNIVSCVFIFLASSALAQNDFALKSRPAKIWLYNNQGNLTRGILVSTSDSTVNIFPGKVKEWGSQSTNSVVSLSYLNTDNIKTHKKGGLINGIGIGAGIGLLPALLSSAFGKGEGGAIVSVFTFPVGIIAGAIIGSTSKKKFIIGGEASRFHLFHKRMKY